MTQETGTLAELNVKPGDVVECVNKDGYEGIRFVCHEKHPKDYTDEPCVVYDNGYRSGYLYCKDREDWKFRIISRAAEPLPYGHVRLPDGSVFDMTAERQPAFGMLTEEEQAALKAQGGPYQMWGTEWSDLIKPRYLVMYAYRVKPQPVRKTVTRDMWGDTEGHLCYYAPTDETPVTVTYETVNGKVDWSTYRVEVK